MAATSSTRATLLARVVAYFVEHGVANYTLRSLAAEIGTSHQLLMYHFASREALTREALGQLHAQVLTDLDRYLESEPTARHPAGVWSYLTRPGPNRFRVQFQCLGLALTDPEHYGEFGPEIVRVWREFTERLLEDRGITGEAAETIATLLVGAMRGLALDLLATDDRARVDAAITLLDGIFESQTIEGRASLRS